MTDPRNHTKPESWDDDDEITLPGAGELAGDPEARQAQVTLLLFKLSQSTGCPEGIEQAYSIGYRAGELGQRDRDFQSDGAKPDGGRGDSAPNLEEANATARHNSAYWQEQKAYSDQRLAWATALLAEWRDRWSTEDGHPSWLYHATQVLLSATPSPPAEPAFCESCGSPPQRVAVGDHNQGCSSPPAEPAPSLVEQIEDIVFDTDFTASHGKTSRIERLERLLRAAREAGGR